MLEIEIGTLPGADAMLFQDPVSVRSEHVPTIPAIGRDTIAKI